MSDTLGGNEVSIFREVKAAKNQALFREVNERIKEVGERTNTYAYAEDAICECANEECSESISITEAEYERVRQNATWFVVYPAEEHVVRDVERVLKEEAGYWVVEKLDQAAVVATKLDPRRRQRSVTP
jgi:hypothetical protein